MEFNLNVVQKVYNYSSCDPSPLYILFTPLQLCSHFGLFLPCRKQLCICGNLFFGDLSDVSIPARSSCFQLHSEPLFSNKSFKVGSGYNCGTKHRLRLLIEYCQTADMLSVLTCESQIFHLWTLNYKHRKMSRICFLEALNFKHVI